MNFKNNELANFYIVLKKQKNQTSHKKVIPSIFPGDCNNFPSYLRKIVREKIVFSFFIQLSLSEFIHFLDILIYFFKAKQGIFS